MIQKSTIRSNNIGKISFIFSKLCLSWPAEEYKLQCSDEVVTSAYKLIIAELLNIMGVGGLNLPCCASITQSFLISAHLLFSQAQAAFRAPKDKTV